jgi:hypothetical protein
MLKSGVQMIKLNANAPLTQRQQPNKSATFKRIAISLQTE